MLPTKILVVIALVAFSACNHPVPAQPHIEWRLPLEATVRRDIDVVKPRPLRVVTYNVHRISNTALTRAMMADESLRNADVILMQEVHKSSECSPACAAAKALGMYSMYAPGHGVHDGSDGVAILSRTPLYNAHVIELNDHFVMFNGGRRVALVAQTTVFGVPTQLISVHLENRITADKRREQLRPVLSYAKKAKLPTIITGDMNTTPFTWLGGVLPFPSAQGCWLEDLARSEGFDTPVTDSGPTAEWLSMRLDAIYTRDVTVVNSHVGQNVRASDHFPLFADIVLPVAVKP
jgi:endonuclease/exonuclease/phosphatase family metal-dependent hydrolase